MRLELDSHCHTIASGHAYSTVTENAAAAAKKGLALIAITDHAPAMPGAFGYLHFVNLRVIPNFIHGVEILKGVELSVLGANGDVDLPENILKKMEVVIASLHTVCFEPSDWQSHTMAIINAMKNPYVKILGHPGDPRYPFDVDAAVNAAADYGVAIEMNDSSLTPGSARGGDRKMMRDILLACAKKNVNVTLGSDAHYMDDIGRFNHVEQLIEEVKFPKELILNYSVEKFKKTICPKI
ncbi:MAG: phosphatase [Clostridiales bacterium]|nr:phosphatase [Clostridiales bacterium]